MTEIEFNRLAAQGYNRIPVVLETFADLDTPLSVYLKLANRPYSYLLESVQGGERFGRYSFIGLPATTRIEARGNHLSVINGPRSQATEVDDPLAFVESYLSRFKAAPYPGLPRFCGGLAGYFAYDTVRYIEHRLAGHARTDTLNTPDILLLLSEELAVVDNLSGKLYLIVYADPVEVGAYQTVQTRLKELLALLRQPVEIPLAAPNKPGEAVSEFSEADFIAAVGRAKRYIFDGDIMQVVLSQRTSKPYGASPLALYRALRSLNPSPYMFYYHFGEFHVVGASPEILVRLEGGTVTVRPIAGTRPRGKTMQEDAALAADLLADPKERAEHLMLMDLGRNDVGPRCADRNGKSHREHANRALFSRHAHCLQRGRQTQTRPECDGCAARHFPGGHRERRPEGAGDGNHRRTGSLQARHLRRRGGLSGIQWRYGSGHRHSYRSHQRRQVARTGGRGHRCRFRAGKRMDRDPEQSQGTAAGGGDRRRRIG